TITQCSVEETSVFHGVPAPIANRFAIGAGTPWNTEVSSTLHWVIVVDDDHHAPVAQGIEHRSPKAGVGGSNPPGGADRAHSSEHRAPRRPILSDRPPRRLSRFPDPDPREAENGPLPFRAPARPDPRAACACRGRG